MTTSWNGERRKARSTKRSGRPAEATSGESSPGPAFPPMYELVSEFFGSGSALSQAYAQAFVNHLEPWAVLLRAYRKVLNDTVTERSEREQRARFMKALGHAYLEYLDEVARRDSPVLAGRKEIVDAWLRLIDAFLAGTQPLRR
jgi:hypothetical protein